jgi:DNA-directed RNA polymerase subunit RPC12/RpoP
MQAPESPITRRKSERHPCPSCGADLAFDPESAGLVCPYCGTKVAIVASAERIEERPYEEFLHPTAGQLEVLAAGALEVTCQRCGATVTFTPPEVAGECSFCGSTIVAQPKVADPIVGPESVLPFAITQQQATAAFKAWLAGLWFAPNALKRLARHESIDGVYLPFWTYDADTVSDYRGERGEYYYVTETYTETDSQGRQETKTRQVRHTRWYSASGRVARAFDDVLVPATTSVSRSRLDSLQPWDLARLRPYEPAFLAGFKAQRYQVDLAAGLELAKQVMAPVIVQDAAADIGGDEQRVHEVATEYSSITFKHLLLPVYLGAYRFKEKSYQVMVNAQTGEVQGDRPYSPWKIAFLVMFILLVVAIVLYLRQ